MSIAEVHAASGTGFGATVTITMAVSVGDVVVVGVTCGSQPTTSVTDSGGNTYAMVGSFTSAAGQYSEIWTTTATAAAATVTASYSGTGSIIVCGSTYSGVTSVSSSITNSGVGSSDPSLTRSTASGDAVLVAILQADGTPSAYSASSGTIATQTANGSGLRRACAMYKAGPGPITCSVSHTASGLTASDNWSAIGVVLSATVTEDASTDVSALLASTDSLGTSADSALEGTADETASADSALEGTADETAEATALVVTEVLETTILGANQVNEWQDTDGVSGFNPHVLDTPPKATYPSVPDTSTYVYNGNAAPSPLRLEFSSYVLGDDELVSSVRAFAYFSACASDVAPIAITIYKDNVGSGGGAVAVATATLTDGTAGWKQVEWVPDFRLTGSDLTKLALQFDFPAATPAADSFRVAAAYLSLRILTISQLEATTSVDSALQGTADETASADSALLATDSLGTSADSALLATDEEATEADAVLLATDSLGTSADSALEGSGDLSAAADSYVSRFATSRHRSPNPGFRLLVEVDWPSAPRRYSSEDLAVGETGYDGRLVAVDRITLGTGARRDAVSVTLENLPNLATVESLWSDAAPPEGCEVRVYYWFEGDPLAKRIEVFRGTIDHVEEVTEQAVRASLISVEEKYDVSLGSLVDLTAFPDAPDESIGKFQPVVFGTLKRFEGVPVTTIATSRLAASTLRDDATLILEDASRFPVAGTAAIGGAEQVSWTGKAGNSLTGCSRGANSTAAMDYASGVEVIELGTLQVLLAGHSVAAVDAVYAMKGDRLRLCDPSEYSASLTGPATVSFAGGWPTVPTPSGAGAGIAQVQMNVAGASNTADNPSFACAKSPDWTEKNAATVSRTSKTTLEVEQTDDQPSLGDIVRVYAAVEYDDSTLPAADSVQLKDGATVLGTLVAGGNLPSDLRDRAGLGFTRAYDDTHTPPITNPAHTHPGTAASASQFLDTFALVSGTFGSTSNPVTSIFDGKFFPACLTQAVGTNKCRVSLQALPGGSSGTITGVRAKGDAHPLSGGGNLTMTFVLAGVSKQVLTWVDGVARSTLTTSTYTASWADLTASNTYIEITCSGVNHEVYEAWFEVDFTSAEQAQTQNTSSSEITPLLHTVALLEDITASVGGDWAWFKNKTLQVHYSGTANAAATKIIRVSFLVEYVPSRAEPADRVLVDVQGLQPDGDPTEVLKEIVTNDYLLGLPASAYNLGDLEKASTKFQALGYRLDFALTDRPSASDLLTKVADQSRLLYWWENGALCVAFRDDLADLPSPLSRFAKDDIVPDSVSRMRGVLRDAVTDLTGHYGFSWQFNKPAKSAHASASVAVGTRPSEETWDLLQDQASAENLAAFKLERSKLPRYTVNFTAYLPALDVRRGDVVAVATDRFSYEKVEVTQVVVTNEQVQILGVVWDSL